MDELINLELFESKKGFFTVIVNGEFAEMLTKDEALGVVASALFGKNPIFVKTYEDWIKWHFDLGYEDFKPIKAEFLLTQ